MSSISDNQCLKQIAMNFGVGATLGASVGELRLSTPTHHGASPAGVSTALPSAHLS